MHKNGREFWKSKFESKHDGNVLMDGLNACKQIASKVDQQFSKVCRPHICVQRRTLNLRTAAGDLTMSGQPTLHVLVMTLNCIHTE